MDQITHHLTDALLMGHAAGTLPEGFALVVATHVSLCDECRARLGSFDALGGAVLDAVGTEPLSDGSLAATLQRIAAGAPPDPAPKVRGDALFPAPLRDYAGGDVDAVRWRRIGGGVSQAILPTGDREAMVRLLKIPGGTAVPDHGHRGIELTLVLSGAFRDETDRFGVGDVEVANEAMVHQPVAEAGAECICLAATDAPLRFSGLLPRIAQTFLRI